MSERNGSRKTPVPSVSGKISMTTESGRNSSRQPEPETNHSRDTSPSKSESESTVTVSTESSSDLSGSVTDASDDEEISINEEKLQKDDQPIVNNIGDNISKSSVEDGSLSKRDKDIESGDNLAELPDESDELKVAKAMIEAGLADQHHFETVSRTVPSIRVNSVTVDSDKDERSWLGQLPGLKRILDANGRRMGVIESVSEFDQSEKNNNYNKSETISLDTTTRRLDPECYFADGKRVIDYVLIYFVKRVRSKKAQQKDLELRKFRKAFEDKLINIGLDLERVGVEQSTDGKTCCVKIHATWEFMARQAELMQLKAPIERSNYRPDGQLWFVPLLRYFFGRDPLALDDEYKAEELTYCGTKFDRRRQEMFAKLPESSFFTPIQRISLVDSVVRQVTIGRTKSRKKGKRATDANTSVPVNLHYLMNTKKAYVAAFPLHDSPTQYEVEWQNPFNNVPVRCHPYRKWLCETWGSFRLCFKYQPLPQIRAYFGEEIGYYFALLALYCKALLFPGVVSLIFVFISLIQANYDPVVEEICTGDEFKNKYYCRLCTGPKCGSSNVSDACFSMKLSRTFDNSWTVAFSIFIAIWAVFFMEFWKRRQNELAAIWDATDDSGDSSLRPDFIQKAPKLHINPLTNTAEPYFPTSTKIIKTAVSMVVMLLCTILNLLHVYAIILYREASYAHYLKHGGNSELSLINTYILSSMLCAVGIALLEVLFQRVALGLTNYECPPTEEEFQASYVRKFIFLEFFNYYSQFMYIAALKGQFADAPHLQPKFADRCGPAGCLLELNIHLIVIMIGKQIAHTLLKFTYRRVRQYWVKRKATKVKSSRSVPRYLRDFLLEEYPDFGLTANYVDLVLLYGFVVLFAAVYPVAALFALLYSVFKIRLDADQILTSYRRPVPKRCRDIGYWMDILGLLTHLSVITNGIVIAVTSQFVDRIVYQLYYSADGSLHGYLSHIWAEFDTADYRDGQRFIVGKDNSTRNCFYKDYRYNFDTDTPYDRGVTWWQVTAARLAFILLFEHVVMFIQGFVSNTVSDVPESVVLHNQRTKQLVKSHYLKSGGHSEDKSVKSGGSEEFDECRLDEGGRRTEGGIWTEHCRNNSPTMTRKSFISKMITAGRNMTDKLINKLHSKQK